MATTGQVFPTSGTSTAEAPWSDTGLAWVTPEAVVSDNATYANVTSGQFDATDQTEVLKAFGFDFSTVPDGSAINGVTARVEARADSTSVFIDLAQLLNVSGAKVGTNLALAPADDIALTTSDTVYTIGGTTSLWGNVLTAAWVKDPDFGIALGARADVANSQVFIDYVTLEIDYTPPPVTLDGTGTAAATASGALSAARPVTAVASAAAAASGDLTVTAGEGGAADVAEVVFYTGDEASTLTVTKPAAFAAGQALIFAAVTNGTSLAALTTSDPDWAEEGTVSSSNHQGKVWSHVHDGAEGASWDFSYGSTLLAGALIRVTNPDTTPVIGVVTTALNSASSMDSATITPDGDNDLLITVLGVNGANNAFSYTHPDGTTNRGSVQLIDLFEAIAVASQKLTSGSATGVRTWTGVAPTGQQSSTFTIAVKSSGAGGGTVDLDAAGSAAAAASGSLEVARPITASGPSAAATAGSLATVRPIAGTGSAAATATGSLTATRPLAGAGSAAATAGTALTVTRPITGVGTAAAAAQGNLDVSTDTLLTGLGSAAATASGTIQAARPLAVAGQAAAAGTATLTLTVALAGAAPTAAQCSGTLIATRPLTATAPTAGSASADLTVLAAYTPAHVGVDTGTTTSGLVGAHTRTGVLDTATTAAGHLDQ